MYSSSLLHKLSSSPIRKLEGSRRGATKDAYRARGRFTLTVPDPLPVKFIAHPRRGALTSPCTRADLLSSWFFPLLLAYLSLFNLYAYESPEPTYDDGGN